MSSKIARLFVLSAQIIVTLAMLGICIQGFFLDFHWLNHIEFAECFARLICISVFTVFYYHSLSSGFGTDTLFIPVFFLFSVLTETRILNTFSIAFSYFVFPPLEIVNIFIFSTIMSVLPLIGYCLFFDNRSSDSALRFLISSIVGCIILTNSIPKTQNFNEIWNYPSILLIIYASYTLAFVVCIITLWTDKPGPDFIRHLVCLILIIGNYINLFFNTFVMNIIGTAFLLVANIIIITMTKKNAIKM